MSTQLMKKIQKNNFMKNNSAQNVNNINLSQSTSSYRKNKNQRNEKYQINCDNNSKFCKSCSVNQINYNANNENMDELILIQNLWEDLGVMVDYQKQFLEYIISLQDEQEKTEIYYYEKNNLRKFRESLIKLSIEISNRDNNIFKLKKYIISLENYVIEKKDSLDKNIFDKIQNTIKDLRLNAVNIINQIVQLQFLKALLSKVSRFGLREVK